MPSVADRFYSNCSQGKDIPHLHRSKKRDKALTQLRLQRLLLKPSNSERTALENAKSHYDTSNFMFSSFLSSDLSYSCALWKTSPTVSIDSDVSPKQESSAEEETLAEAQLRKVHNIIDKAKIKKGHHVLDIGGGWAFLAIEAVKKTGCRVTVTTLSVEQKSLGEAKVKEEGLEENIEVSKYEHEALQTG